MIIKLTNDDPEFPIYLRSEHIIYFARATGSRKTQIITDLSGPGGPIAWMVQEEPQEIAQMLATEERSAPSGTRQKGL